ncbi:MAG: hypothetical protein HYY62_06530 [Deltaproteobacteria bacterium]|nr:hypothetical protein [Deltaproteobacteria bacterium]
MIKKYSKLILGVFVVGLFLFSGRVFAESRTFQKNQIRVIHFEKTNTGEYSVYFAAPGGTYFFPYVPATGFEQAVHLVQLLKQCSAIRVNYTVGAVPQILNVSLYGMTF